MFYLFAILTALACLVFPFTMYTIILLAFDLGGHKIVDMIFVGLGFLWMLPVWSILLEYKELSGKQDTDIEQDDQTFKL